MKMNIKKGRTSYIATIFIQDSSSTTGAGLTGLTSASGGLVCYQARPDQGNAGGTQLTLSAGTRGTWSSGGFVEKDSANLPGVYELGLANSMLATGADYVVVMLKGATNMAPLPIEIALTDYDPQDPVALGLSRIDAAISSRMATFTLPTNFSSLSIDGSGRIDLGKWIGVAPAALTTNGYVQTTLLRWLTDNAGGTPNALIAGRVDANAQVVGDKTNYVLTQTFPANFSSLAITGGGAVTAGTVSDKTGYSLTAAEENAIADAFLNRNVAGGSSAGRLVKEALYVLRNKTDIEVGVLTVYQTDDLTPAFTAAVTTAAGNPIITIDPA